MKYWHRIETHALLSVGHSPKEIPSLVGISERIDRNQNKAGGGEQRSSECKFMRLLQERMALIKRLFKLLWLGNCFSSQ